MSRALTKKNVKKDEVQLLLEKLFETKNEKKINQKILLTVHCLYLIKNKKVKGSEQYREEAKQFLYKVKPEYGKNEKNIEDFSKLFMILLNINDIDNIPENKLYETIMSFTTPFKGGGYKVKLFRTFILGFFLLCVSITSFMNAYDTLISIFELNLFIY